MAVVSGNGVHHSREDALQAREYQLLLEGARDLDDDRALEARMVCLVAGRLGLRAGEIAHIREEWVDWRRNMIVVPEHEPCQKGQDGGVCGYCRHQAQQMTDRDPSLTLAETASRMWSPKTRSAAREVPFGHDPRAMLVLERFFDENDQWPNSRAVVNRRVTAAAEEADEIDASSVYPHALRATAASYHAGRGLDMLPLQSLFGWADLRTAKSYIAQSGENTARALQMVHSR